MWLSATFQLGKVCVRRACEWRRDVKLSLSTVMWEHQLSGTHGNIQWQSPCYTAEVSQYKPGFVHLSQCSTSVWLHCAIWPHWTAPLHRLPPLSSSSPPPHKTFLLQFFNAHPNLCTLVYSHLWKGSWTTTAKCLWHFNDFLTCLLSSSLLEDRLKNA